MITDIEGVFNDSPEITDYLRMPHPGRSDRNTITHRMYEGGSLKIVHAGAPRTSVACLLAFCLSMRSTPVLRTYRKATLQHLLSSAR
jgi:hypothetical protein